MVSISGEVAETQAALPSFRLRAWSLLLAIWFAVYFLALFSPALLDDADATHANAARHMAISGDWVTLRVDGIRYLEKPPLPYWLVAVCYKIFGFNSFATHLPLAAGVLALTWLAWTWALRAYGERAALYAALSVETAAGVFLFTRILIPEILLTFLIATALFTFLLGLEARKAWHFYIAYAAIALAVLAKGLIAPVFFGAAVVPYLLLTGDWRKWRHCRLLSGALIFLAIALPWHVVAAIRNPGEGHPGPIPAAGNVHGFLWFYFINEHWLRFLGRRYPRDYNKLPGYLYWTLHLVWLFPWSLWFAAAIRDAVSWWRKRASANLTFGEKTTRLLLIYAAFILIFFSLSTNQEYYTFPTYFPLLVLTAVALARMETSGRFGAWIDAGHIIFIVLGACVFGALAYGLWASRKLPFVPDIGSLLAHRGVGNYTLSMSHFFDLTTESFAALRLPAMIAAITFASGPIAAYLFRRRRNDIAATVSIALTSAVFLIAAHIAFVRFEPMLSSRALADAYNHYARETPSGQKPELLLYGDQSYGSSLIFYTGTQAYLVNGRTSSMIWGSYYSDAPRIFLNDEQLRSEWGTGQRKFLFIPEEFRAQAEQTLDSRWYLVKEVSGKQLVTDRPLRRAQ